MDGMQSFDGLECSYRCHLNLQFEAVERSLDLYLEVATPQSAPTGPEDTWLLLRDAAVGTPYSQEYLSLLARTGRLEARKRGQNWVTTRRAIEAYRQSVDEKQRKEG